MAYKKRYSWTSLAKEIGVDVRTLKKNCFGIMRRLNKMAGRKDYRILTAAQSDLIKKHLDYTSDEHHS